ncbi:MAG: type II secretion system F family protein [Candidatus Moranbacteria bacterium]|nr:type II secretion system F family protein [Candidatus Moranbacteria bacterium]
MKFLFKAKNKGGELKEGVIEAASSEVAIELLQKNDLFPLAIKEEGNNDSIEKIFLKYLDRVDTRELMVFFRQLAILIEAKVPIVSSLNAIKEQIENKYFQKIIAEMVGDVQDGLPFSDALKKHRDIFSSLAINIIKAGEVSGNLKRSIEYVADNIEKNYKLSTKIKSAMMYPIIVLVVFFVIAFLVVSFVVPKLTVMIKDMGPDIVVPWYTQVIIVISDFMASYWWAIAVAIILFVGGVVYYIKSEDGSREWDQIKIKLPIFGKIYQNLYVARFADNLAVLLSGGIPIIQSLNIVSSVIDNVVYESIFLKAADEVRIGGSMSDVLRRSPQIPAIVSQMVRIGEESGQIDSVLAHVARFYEQEADNMAKNLSTLIEPLLMVAIGVAVAFLSFSVIMPIYNIAGQM